MIYTDRCIITPDAYDHDITLAVPTVRVKKSASYLLGLALQRKAVAVLLCFVGLQAVYDSFLVLVNCFCSQQITSCPAVDPQQLLTVSRNYSVSKQQNRTLSCRKSIPFERVQPVLNVFLYGNATGTLRVGTIDFGRDSIWSQSARWRGMCPCAFVVCLAA